MRVLLLKDVRGLGQAGEIREVAGGYAQNYLLPNRLATPVTAAALKQVDAVREAAARRRNRQLTEAKNLVSSLEGRVVTFEARSGEGDRLYGSITSTEIAEQLSKATGLEIDRRTIELEHPIKTLGEHPVVVKLGGGLSAHVTALVVRQEQP